MKNRKLKILLVGVACLLSVSVALSQDRYHDTFSSPDSAYVKANEALSRFSQAMDKNKKAITTIGEKLHDTGQFVQKQLKLR